MNGRKCSTVARGTQQKVIASRSETRPHATGSRTARNPDAYVRCGHRLTQGFVHYETGPFCWRPTSESGAPYNAASRCTTARTLHPPEPASGPFSSHSRIDETPRQPYRHIIPNRHLFSRAQHLPVRIISNRISAFEQLQRAALIKPNIRAMRST